MKKYAIVVDEEKKLCNVGLGTDTEYYKSIGMTEQDVEKAYDGNWYLVGYAPQQPEVERIQEQVAELESQVEKINQKLLRDIRVILNPNATTEEKAQAQTYYNTKIGQIEELVEQINSLKN